jgi:hypothetical protein
VKSSNKFAPSIRRRGIEKSDQRHCRLLGVRRERPHRRRNRHTAENRDELAPSHVSPQSFGKRYRNGSNGVAKNQFRVATQCRMWVDTVEKVARDYRRIMIPFR